TVTCSPVSGSFFPVGTSSVTCTATDQSGNQARCSFAVSVIESVSGLRIERAGGNMIVSWPVTCGTYVLEQAANLNPVINWVPAPAGRLYSNVVLRSDPRMLVAEAPPPASRNGTHRLRVAKL